MKRNRIAREKLDKGNENGETDPCGRCKAKGRRLDKKLD